MLRFRLALKLFLVVFAAIVVIEFIIVIPSYGNYESSLQAHYREVARIAASAALTHHSHESSAIASDLENLIAADSRLVGASAIDTNGSAIASAGETAEFIPGEEQRTHAGLSGHAARYELYFSAAELGIEAGMNDYIAKPFVKKQLARLLDLYLPPAELDSRRAG